MKLLLAEDTADLNRAICAVLSHEGHETVSAYDGEEALACLRSDSFDCIILDIMMPRKNGIEVLQELRAGGIFTPVLLLTAKAEVDDKVTGLDAGADDYLTKPFAMKELLARIRALTRRKNQYSPDDLVFEDLSLKAGTFELSSENSVRLSIKEFSLMQALIMNAGRELSTQYLLDHIWADEEGAVSDTVWLYICYLKGKLRSIASAVTISGTSGGSFSLHPSAAEDRP